jgi:hypothetical protein
MTFGCLTYGASTYEDFFAGDLKDAILLIGTSAASASINWFPHDLYLYNPYEVLNLPLTEHATDLSCGVAKTSPATAKTLTLVGSPAPTVTSAGLAFNDASAYNHYAWLAGTDDFSGKPTIDFHYTFQTQWAVDDHTIIGQRVDGGNQWQFYMRQADAQLEFYIYFSDAYQVLMTSSGLTWTNDQEYHIQVYADADGWYMLRDGVQVATTAQTGSIPTGWTAQVQLGIWSSSTKSLRGKIRNLMIFKDSNLLPVSNYRYAGQDLRFLWDGAKTLHTFPPRGFNGYTGEGHAMVNIPLTNAASNVLTVAMGKNTATAPSEGVSWPSSWKRVMFRRSVNDLVASLPVTLVGGATFSDDGLDCESAKYGTMPDGSDVTFLANDMSIVAMFTPTNSVTSQGAFYSQFADGSNWFQVYHRNSLLYVLSRTSGGDLAYYTAAATFSAGTTYTVIVARNGSTLYGYINGSAVTWTVDTAIGSNSLPDLAAPVAMGFDQNNTVYFTGKIGAMFALNGTYIDAVQASVIDTALRTPDLFASVGSLGPYPPFLVLDGGDPDAMPTRYFDGGDPDSIGTRDIDGGIP